ncbi:MAG: family 20 glycosylhydrolase [Bacteroidaceae bacterium]|nr:family 20 glycosylhydrolase [Bacteroidaceae bacterium]MBQ2045157.1 family 20 glycosylhydrolase [Bacteroidaceae bacterium]MBQ2458048.1 family 20 glycosylhydrolase [Bacteroidaceae bacterium]MBQ5740671.1 family 20 glycosylhydrolase [Bacteroidaceae bacterium]
MKLKDKLLGLIGMSVAGLIMFSCTEVKEANYQIIPMPLDIQQAEQGMFILTEGTPVIYPEGNAKMQNNANFLAEYVKEKTGITLAPSAGTDGKGIILKVEENKEKPEGYSLKVSADNVIICGGSEAGVFYGIQTLRKSLPVAQGGKVALPAVEINDAPRFNYRGGMLDVARHYFTLDSLKRYIDLLAMHNINRFHWHLSEDQGWRIEIKSRPLLTEKGSMRKQTVIGRNSGKYDGKPYGGFYTQEEAREIVAYAADRYITVIPEIDMPGHMMGALHAYPELGCTGGPYDVWCQWGVSEEVLCAGNDATLKFIEDVLGEIVQIFPSEYIHVGGDECPKTRWKSCPKCQARIKALGIKGDEKHTAEEYLQSFVINHAEKFLNSKGRQMIGWDETLEGGLAPNATVMSWRGEGGGIEAARQKHNVIMTPNTYLYFDYYQTKDTENEPLAIGGYLPLERVYSYEPMPKALSAEEQKYIVGVQANLWAEYITTFSQAEYMLLPRLAALSEIQWSSADKKNYECFLSRLPRMVQLYDVKQYNYATHAFDITANLVPDSNEGVLKVSFKTIDNCPIHYTLDGSEPTASSPLYKDTLKITEACTISAVGIRPTGKSRVFTEKLNIHKATFKPITLMQPSSRGYTFGGAGTLLDGLKGQFNYKTGHWIGFQGNDVEAMIDMKEPTEVSSVSVSTLVEKGDWIFGARTFAVYTSEDGKDFKEVACEEYPAMTLDNPNQIYEHTLKFNPVSTRYLKVFVQSEHSMPLWHGSNGAPAFIFIDEIVVE